MAFRLSETMKPTLDVTASELVSEVETAGSIGEYLATVDDMYFDLPIHSIFAGLATFVEPDRKAPEAPAAQAFMRGAVLGLRAIELAIGPSAVTELATIEWFTRNNEKLPEVAPEEVEDTIRRVLLGMGHAGYTIADAFHGPLEDWDLAVTRNAATTRVFKDGFGFPIFHAQRYIDKQSTDDIFDAILERSGIFADWDPLTE